MPSHILMLAYFKVTIKIYVSYIGLYMYQSLEMSVSLFPCREMERMAKFSTEKSLLKLITTWHLGLRNKRMRTTIT